MVKGGIGLAVWLAAGCLGAASAQPPSEAHGAQLDARLQARFADDRSGACVVAAVIDGAEVTRGRVCARPDRVPPAYDSAFEIGSISKTMTAFLVADLIAAGRWSLDDPIARHLPAATSLPRFAGQPERQILLRDLLTHSSGLPALPARMGTTDMADPYARLTAANLLASLDDVTLTAPIGSQVAYSNFGMMIVSLAVARAYGDDLEAALRTRLFEPLGMKNAFIASAPAGVTVQRGHLPTGLPTAAWQMAPNLASVGAVKASLDDMVRYAQAQLNLADAPLGERMRLTQQPLAHGYGMNWQLPRMAGRGLVMHEGGTGGFSSLLALDPARRRAVVLLADAGLADLGGLGDIGLPLLGLERPAGRPRVEQVAPAALRQALAGDYELAGLPLRLWIGEDDRLMLQAQGQSAFELRYDSHGDFYPLTFSALLRPVVDGAGPVQRFAWRQGGGLLEARRRGSQPALTASNPLWKEWAGDYQLAPQFSLRVYEEAGRLLVQGSGQPAMAAEVAGPDRIEVKAVGAVIEFQRDAAGSVSGATLKQGGQILPGRKR